MRSAVASSALFLLVVHGTSTAVDFSRGEDRLGLTAPRIGLEHWLYSRPLEIDALRGKVLLVRWWTEECPFCAATAPALRALDRKYGHGGLQVIGVFHPKPPGDWNVERMRAASERLGFTFPVALDAEWTALRRWWPGLEKRGWTSVSFVVDRKGIIRYVHPGGEFHESKEEGHAHCDRDYRDIERIIGRLLSE
jgi:peroxiredoxin